MNVQGVLAHPVSRRLRVLVAAAVSPPALTLSGECVDDPEFTFVGSADEAIEAALSHDFELVLLDLGLSGIGAVAAADILRRAGAPGTLVAIGSPEPGTVFDRFLAPPVAVEAVRDLLRATGIGLSAGALLDDGWIERECADLAAEFRDGLVAAAAKVQGLSKAGDVASLAAHVHSLKGCAGAYGHHEVARHCTLVEAGLRRGQHEVTAIAALVDALVEASAT